MDIATIIVLGKAVLGFGAPRREVTPPTEVPTGIPPKFPTTFGTDPIKFLFPFFTPDPKFIVKEPKGRPQCALGEKAVWFESTNEYRCVPKLL